MRMIGRSYALGMRSLVLVLVGLGAAAACSDDSSGGGNSAPNGGGEGGESTATGGTGGTSAAGTSANGGTQNMSGAPSNAAGEAGMTGEAGMAGMAGAPPAPVPTLGEQCTSCGATECGRTLESCNGSADCAAWLSCLKSCDTAECVSGCDADHVIAARIYAGVYDCLCTSCQDDCSGANACGKKTCVDDNPLPLMAKPPATLAETGLFELVDSGSGGAGGAGNVELAMPIAIAAGVQTYEPSYALWADGATKQRYVYIPKCSTIDTTPNDDLTTSMDHWRFPVGTTFWKSFSVDGALVETRMLHRFGVGPLDWTYAAYQWPAVAGAPDPSLATLVADTGLKDANGTTHDIPSVGQCKGCHNRLSEKVLGFGAIQLSHDAKPHDLDIKKVSDLGWLTTPAPNGFQIPGTPVQQAALGYLHANCGGCHNEVTPLPAGDPQLLRQMVGQNVYATNDAVKSTVGVVVQSQNPLYKGKDRIAPMDPENSVILMRMDIRDHNNEGRQMPPLGTEVVDPDGVKAITDWVNSIPKN